MAKSSKLLAGELPGVLLDEGVGCGGLCHGERSVFSVWSLLSLMFYHGAGRLRTDLNMNPQVPGTARCAIQRYLLPWWTMKGLGVTGAVLFVDVAWRCCRLNVRGGGCLFCDVPWVIVGQKNDALGRTTGSNVCIKTPVLIFWRLCGCFALQRSVIGGFS